MQIFRVRTGLVAAATCASLAVAGLPGVPVAVAAPAAAASAADYWDKHDSASVDLKANQSIDDVALGSTITFDVAAPESAPEGGSLSLFVDGQQVDELPAEQPPSDWFSNFIANPAKLSLAAIIIGIANLLGIGAILATLWGNGMFATFGANGSSGAGVPFWGPHGRN